MATFTLNNNFGEGTNHKDWAYHLGNLPMDSHIVFSKKGLLDFLKANQIEVGPNYTELSRLPRYATIGRFDSDPAHAGSAVAGPGGSSAVPAVPAAAAPMVLVVQKEGGSLPNGNGNGTTVRLSDGGAFRPTRRVREAVGGGSEAISRLFGGGGSESSPAPAPVSASPAAPARPARPDAPAAPVNAEMTSTPAARETQAQNGSALQAQEDRQQHAVFRPTRRVREPGGTGGLSSITFG